MPGKKFSLKFVLSKFWCFPPAATPAAALILLLLTTSGCIFQTAKNSTPAGKPTDETISPPPPAQQSNAGALPAVSVARAGLDEEKQSDRGDFIVEHRAPKNARFAELERKFKSEKLLEKTADTLNRSLILPHDIFLRTNECGESNAHYDPSDRSITICYELLEHFQKLFRAAGSAEADADRKMLDAVRFAFLHELGHALIEAYKLPITGGEEDAADRLSSYICLEEMGEEGIRAVLAAAEAFRVEAKQGNLSSEGSSSEEFAGEGQDYSDEHLLHGQRFYNTLCMIYGSDAVKYDYFVKQKFLPAARAERCPNEYERMAESWSALLRRWRKD